MSWIVSAPPAFASRAEAREASIATIEQEGALPQEAPRRRLFYRHRLLVRISHWLNFICLTILLMSGLQIFNAHPALYWGIRSTFNHPLFVLQHGFPGWATLPSVQWLAMGRRWHFFFAWVFVLNGLVYFLYSLASGHLWRDLLPSRRDLGHIWRSLIDHLRLRFPEGEAARRYNVLQKLAYLIVIYGLAPLMILTGLTMSPRVDAGWPFLLELFGGRQSARTLHFICAFSLLAFFIIHIVMVLLSGVWNNLRSMITGRYAVTLRGEKGEGDAQP